MAQDALEKDLRNAIARGRIVIVAGVAFDGDRIVMADEQGRLLDGIALLAILAVDMLERGEVPQNTIVTTIMLNAGLERAIKPHGGNKSCNAQNRRRQSLYLAIFLK